MVAKVTVGITTYNLDKYISTCLDSILCQKTNFKFSILVVDDASTDNTVSILKSYKERFPSVIDVIYKRTNEGSLKSSNLLFSKIKTQYFSFIDGDDLWVSNTRLQEAIDFLDKNVHYAMYAGNCRYMVNDQIGDFVTPTEMCNKTYTYDDYANGACPFIHTSGIVLRNVVYCFGIPSEYIKYANTIYDCVFRGEDIRFADHIRKGPVFVTDKQYSIYRIHNKGLWQGSSQIKRTIESCLQSLLYQRLFPEMKSLCQKRFLDNYHNLMSIVFNQYNVSDLDHTLFINFFNEIHSINYDCWTMVSSDIKKSDSMLKMKKSKRIQKVVRKIVNILK